MENKNSPIIIKKKKVVGGGGHHGGAWKVAYADFVTAMMAFFMLMWLLNATTEKQRKGIADHFNPSIPINRISGGGEGAFGGDSIFSDNTLAKNETGSSGQKAPWQSDVNSTEESAALQDALDAALLGGGGESDLLENALKHVISRISDEGVIVEIFDLPGRPLFSENGTPQQIVTLLIEQISDVARSAQNPISVRSHARTEPVVKVNVNLWEKTARKSLIVRGLLEKTGVSDKRFDRVVGKADTSIFSSDALSVRNNRVEIIFLIEND